MLSKRLLLGTILVRSRALLLCLSAASTLAQPNAARHRTPSAPPYAWLAIVRSLMAQIGGDFVVCFVPTGSHAPPRVAGSLDTFGVFYTSALPHHAFAQTCCLLD